MSPTTLPATLLPRARSLTDALTAPAGPPPPPRVAAGLSRTLRDGLAEATVGYAGPPVRVDAFAIRTAGEPGTGHLPAGGDSFRWTPRAARRAVGVSAAARIVGGRARNPAQGAELAVTALVEDARRGGARPGSLAAWLGSAPPGVVAAVLGEATTWATHLVTAIEWPRVGRDAELGGADRWWDLRGRPGVGLRGRADVRLAVAPFGRVELGRGPSTARQSLLTLMGGRPGPGSRAELGLAALVDVLRRPFGPAPVRVVGWWPECGRALVLDVDGELLASTATATIDAVRCAVRRRRLRAVRDP